MDIVPISQDLAEKFCASFHPYKGCGKVNTYKFGVIECGELRAVLLFNPPPPGLALELMPDRPSGVLSFSRMCAVDKNRRGFRLRKVIRHCIKKLIDRNRYPVIATFADTSFGHDGYIYKISGFTHDKTTTVMAYHDGYGKRVSVYSAGKRARGIVPIGNITLLRFVHRM